MTYANATLCDNIGIAGDEARRYLVGWAVDEPDTLRRYTGLVFGTLGIILLEHLARREVGCYPPAAPHEVSKARPVARLPVPTLAAQGHLVAYGARPRGTPSSSNGRQP